MSFTNAQLAQKISNLIDYWSSFVQEYDNWLGGTVDGGPGSDGKYPLTNWAGVETLVDSPAKLADNVSGYVGLASASEAAAAASAAAAATSESNASTSAATATAQAVLADADRVAAEAAEANATSAQNTSVVQANLATDRAGYAQEWANKAVDSLVSVAAGGDNVDDYSAMHHATKGAASAAAALASETAAAASAAAAATFDPALYAALADDETITGQWKFLNTGVSSWLKLQKGGASNTVGLDFINESGVRRLTNYLSNAQDFYMDWYNSSGVWQGSAFVIDTDTGNITMGAALSVTGAVTGSNLNVSNWDTAYGWGDHAGLYSLAAHNHAGVYEPADATILKDADIGVTVAAFSHNHSGVYEPVDASIIKANTLTQEDGYVLLNRNNASNVVLHVTQAGAGPVAQFGGGVIGGTPTSDVVKINQGNVEINGDGELLTLKNDNHTSSDNLLNSWIRWKDSAGTDMAWLGFGSNSNNDLGIYHSESGKNIRMGTVGAGDVLMLLGATGALEITGSSYKTNPTGLRLGQYTATLGYIQAPASGSVAIWNDGTGEVARFDDDSTVHIPAGALNLGVYGTTQGGVLNLHGTTINKTATIKCTSGNLHIDSETGASTYINYYEGSSVYMGHGGSTWDARVHSAGLYVQGTDTNPGALVSALSSNMLHIDGKEAIDGNDTYMRLNQNTDFSSGVYTPGALRVDGSLKLNADCTLSRQGSSQCRVQTSYGYTEIGPNNTSWAHFNTDRANFYFNKGAHFAGQPKYYALGAMYYNGASTYASGKVTYSTSAATGGSSGDIWYQYT